MKKEKHVPITEKKNRIIWNEQFVVKFFGPLHFFPPSKNIVFELILCLARAPLKKIGKNYEKRKSFPITEKKNRIFWNEKFVVKFFGTLQFFPPSKNIVFEVTLCLARAPLKKIGKNYEKRKSFPITEKMNRIFWNEQFVVKFFGPLQFFPPGKNFVFELILCLPRAPQKKIGKNYKKRKSFPITEKKNRIFWNEQVLIKFFGHPQFIPPGKNFVFELILCLARAQLKKIGKNYEKRK